MSYRIGVGNSANGDLYRGFDTSPGGDIAGCFVAITRWNCEPGTKTITEFAARTAFMTNVGAYVVVYSKSGSTFTLVGSEQITGFAVSDTTQGWGDTSVNLSVTLADGVEYYFGLAMTRPAADGSGQPGTRVLSGLLDANESYFMSLSGESVPSSFATTDGSDPLNNADAPAFTMTYTSTSGVEYDSGTSFAGSNLLIPLPHDATGYVVCNDWTVADTATGTIDLRYITATSASRVAAVMDFGATDQMTFAGLSNALTGEAGDTFDVALKFDSDNAGGDLLYLNRTEGQGPNSDTSTAFRDIATISHYAAQNAARGTYTYTSEGYLAFSGTKPDRVRVCDAESLVVLLGDSQIGTKGAGIAAVLHRLGSAIETLDTDKVFWNAAIAGGRLGSSIANASTSGILRHTATTPGQGDIVSLTGCKVVCTLGLNDISVNVSNEATSTSYPDGQYTTDLETLAAACAGASQTLVLFGAPPYSANVANIEWKSAGMLNANRAMYAVALGDGTPYTSPFRTMWTGGKDANGAFVFNPDYTVDSGTHYNDTGAALAAPLLEQAIDGVISNGGDSLVVTPLSHGRMGTIGRPLRGRM